MYKIRSPHNCRVSVFLTNADNKTRPDQRPTVRTKQVLTQPYLELHCIYINIFKYFIKLVNLIVTHKWFISCAKANDWCWNSSVMWFIYSVLIWITMDLLLGIEYSGQILCWIAHVHCDLIFRSNQNECFISEAWGLKVFCENTTQWSLSYKSASLPDLHHWCIVHYVWPLHTRNTTLYCIISLQFGFRICLCA